MIEFEITGMIMCAVGIVIGSIGFFIGNEALYVACFVPAGVGFYSLFVFRPIEDILKG